MGIATAIIVIGIMVTAALGPERRGREFEGGPIGTNIHRDDEKAFDADSLEEGKNHTIEEKETKV